MESRKKTKKERKKAICVDLSAAVKKVTNSLYLVCLVHEVEWADMSDSCRLHKLRVGDVLHVLSLVQVQEEYVHTKQVEK